MVAQGGENFVSVSPETQALAALNLGRIDNEDISAYHGAPAVSVSKLKVFRHSPALYYGRFITKKIEPPEPTPALLFGSAAGAAILEGQAVFDRQYYTVPEGVGRQKAEHKGRRAQLELSNPGKEALSFDDVERINRMNANVRAHHLAGPLLAACKPEITWRVRGELFHVQVRTDGFSDEGCEITEGEPYIVDLKTIPALPDDEPDTISKQIAEYWYHGQAYVYREIVSQVSKWPEGFRPRFFFVFVEKAEPYAVQVVELDDTGLDVAYKQTVDTLNRLKECHTLNRWPLLWADTWQKKVPKVELPKYYIRREMGDDNNIW